ncbi:PDR/VanB family oxidoreductase [Burkholderia stabilis]|uniref:Oxidoreductase n=1 Tax=Burkholderia stabilis TaxID=95485 RepID=A0AAJ5N842_9BURK|nr:PDR/VanB family oxidoreductase [Burkholderia stabilis]VBB13588.1 Phthalate dioxygenase reductase,bifunctional nitric oxide dioxygenase/dihydropteridine reductase 2,Uncharacterized Fe-S protein,phenylacetate-CoA oxygenase/reductase, PaaK subunit,Oxidoreductase NAD-binding domain [Burkholderia stabilis]
MNVENATTEVIVKTITHEAAGIRSYELRRKDGQPLPRFNAGSHVDLHLANGLVRSYSLLNDPAISDHYRVAVALDVKSRGGSRHIHDCMQPGDRVMVGSPRNNFALDETADLSVFVAGGIGITPFLAMIKRLDSLGKPWKLYYGARDLDSCAFHNELATRGEQVKIRLESAQEPTERRWDIQKIVQTHSSAHFYCCGPAPMLDTFVAATAAIPPENVHIEHFSAQADAALDGGFVVHLSKAQKTVTVLAGRSILDTILDSGVDVMNSCREGVCGACEVKVLAGTPDHRDSILSESERSNAKTMFICVSGCKSKELVLDI